MTTENCPGSVIEMLSGPPRAQVHRDSAVRAGIPLMRTVGAPGIQGVVVGVHGTVAPAALAATAAGFIGELQIPNGGMFTNGSHSMIVAAGVVAVTMAPSGMTASGIGAAPHSHIIIAPITTSSPIRRG